MTDDSTAPTQTPPETARKTINLALQGGGSHGAFTWGVLDALLEDGRLDFEGISGTSAGAMNAVVLAHSLARTRQQGQGEAAARQSARDALARFWDGVGLMGNFITGVPMPGMQAVMGFMSQWLTPYHSNPLGINPLRQLLEREVDFDVLARQRRLKVFVAATNVRTGQGEIFSGKQLSADAVLASACLPALYQAVKIGDEHYWDGGYSGNPAIYPLIYNTRSADVLLVQINPIAINYVPSASGQEIAERVNEITFNAPLLAELRAIRFVTRLLQEGRLDAERYKNVLMHRIDGGSALSEFGAASKTRADSAFVRRLFELGRQAGHDWLQHHLDAVGQRSSMDDVLPPG